ncbi:MAG: response regulator transcription factor [Nitrospinota bacterium]|jgi:DNA-binding NarL/FixJ family response regulator|nr:response regulator transcription factor [Nitrospinota bacterium]
MNPFKDQTIKVFIVDDHEVVRQGLKHILSQTADIEVIGEAENGARFLEKIMDIEADVILMDIEMPEKNGLETLIQLKTLLPDLPIIILSIFQEDQYGLRLMNYGAAGYLSKTCPPEQLIDAIKKVSTGGKYITPALSEKLVMNFGSNPEKPLHETLSNREYQIFFMMASGQKLRDIANELSISLNTVNAHRTNILKKMCMNSNSELIRYALQNDLVK